MASAKSSSRQLALQDHKQIASRSQADSKQTASRPQADRKQTTSRPQADRKQTASRPQNELLIFKKIMKHMWCLKSYWVFIKNENYNLSTSFYFFKTFKSFLEITK